VAGHDSGSAAQWFSIAVVLLNSFLQVVRDILTGWGLNALLFLPPLGREPFPPIKIIQGQRLLASMKVEISDGCQRVPLQYR
jgi:hypothetical protein